MHLERVLQFGTAALVSLSTILLAMGEQIVVLPLAAVIIAAASVYVTDIKGWISLGTRTADALGILAAIVAVFQWQHDTADAGLLALLNFVVYGQFILQFKRKGVRTYWLLVALSFMEAAVATALNESLAFGIILVLYVFWGIGVLAVFYLYREQVRASRIFSEQHRADVAESATGVTTSPPPPVLPWSFVGHSSEQQADAAINRALARLVGNISGVTLCTACVVFVAIPRSEHGAWREVDASSTQRVVGFAGEVQLGELGAISESAEEVMEVRIEDPLTGEPVELYDEPLFRGVVLATYDNRKWKREIPHGKPLDRQPPSAVSRVLKQRFTVRPLDTNVLFTIFPSFSTGRRTDILWDDKTEQLVRVDRKAGDNLSYELSTTGIVDGRMASLVATQRKPTDYELRSLLSLPGERRGQDPLAGTKALAARIARDVPEQNHLERARIVANYLRDPTNFRYSLGEVRRDPTLDPVEDFLTQNRVGHCEYFASALALMLRQLEIPARLAIGFKGGDWTGSVYQVRALHAHAWVEAYLGPEHLPERLPPGIDRDHGAWLILDPTVGGGAAPGMNARSYLVEGWKNFIASMRTSWRTYVLGMNHSRQQDAIYQPLLRALETTAMRLSDPEFWRTFAVEFVRRLSPGYWGLTKGGWFSWRGALAAIVIMLTMLSAYYAIVALMRRLWRASRAAAVAERARADVEFYRRLEALLAQNQIVRGASQTQREFALAVGGQLAESPHTKYAAPWTRQLAELFYRVRFGGRPLDTQEASTVEQALSGLASALAVAGGRRPQDSS